MRETATLDAFLERIPMKLRGARLYAVNNSHVDGPVIYVGAYGFGQGNGTDGSSGSGSSSGTGTTPSDATNVVRKQLGAL